MSGHIIHIHSMADYTENLKTGAVIVDFFATWCGPCVRIAPQFEKWAAEYPSIKFLKVDVDQCEDVSAAAGVTAMPTFIFFKDGVKLESVVGASVDKIKALLEKHK